MTWPAVVVVVPIEGRASACVEAGSYEEQERLRVELYRPGLDRDVSEALDVLRASLEDMREAA